MAKSYYKRMQIITSNPIWKKYLSWAYQKCIDDFRKISFQPDFSTDNFTALLCGTSGEVTSEQFLKFIFNKNPEAKIIILDISSEQLEKSKIKLSQKYPHKDIVHLLSDAKHTQLNNESVDYIETDGFLEYFNSKNLDLLFNEWKRILRPNGFVTTRAFASSSALGRLIDKLRIFAAKHYLGVEIFSHSIQSMTKSIRNAGLNHVQGGGTLVPTFKRFSMNKN